MPSLGGFGALGGSMTSPSRSSGSGRFRPDGSFLADNLLAKHDERYMPPEVAGKMHKTETLEP